MPTHVFHGDDGAITQVSDAWVHDPVAPVALKEEATPGVAPHSNTRNVFFNASATIFERGVEIANRNSATDAGVHAVQVLFWGAYRET